MIDLTLEGNQNGLMARDFFDFEDELFFSLEMIFVNLLS